jgi:2-polyprenyl-3-methyl-5-hydroxy-6-metoxy-1,4-benzoquinol methylase
MRLKTSPWEIMLNYFPHGNTLIDIGCGHGLLINLLSKQNPGYQKFIGVDLASDKIKIAKQIENDRISFYHMDIFDLEERADVYSILDVLYLIPYDIQEKLFIYIFDIIPEKGHFFIKEVDTKPPWKFHFLRSQETLSVKIFGVTLGTGFYFRSEMEYKKLLEEIGFKVNVMRIDKGYPYPHILYICQK